VAPWNFHWGTYGINTNITNYMTCKLKNIKDYRGWVGEGALEFGVRGGTHYLKPENNWHFVTSAPASRFATRKFPGAAPFPC
jgi:hypothetical protein